VKSLSWKADEFPLEQFFPTVKFSSERSDDKKLKKNTANVTFLLIKDMNLFIPGLHKGHPGYRRGLQSSNNIQHFKE
jgi:hypothetical protein